MEFQPPKYLGTAQCLACGASCRCLSGGSPDADLLQGLLLHSRLSNQGSKAILLGYRESYGRLVCLCVDCYFDHVEQRARSCAAFAQLTPAEIDAKASLMGEGLHPLPDGETEKERCLRWVVIGQGREKFYGKTFLRDHIAVDLGLEPSELFPREVERAYNSTKESIILQVLRVKSVERMRRAMVSWPAILAYLAIVAIGALAIHRSLN